MKLRRGCLSHVRRQYTMEFVARSDPSALRTPGVSGRATISQSITEAQYQAQVTDLLRAYKWRSYHTYDARRSAKGFPDVCAVHARHGVLFAELKGPRGRLSDDQVAWLTDLREVVADNAQSFGCERDGSWFIASVEEPGLTVGLFRPSAFDWLEKIAKGGRP